MILSVSALSNAKPQTYTILNGGGVDDNALVFKNAQGKKIRAYCNLKCGDWFDPDEETGGAILKKKYIGQKVQAELKLEINGNRVIGPGEDAKFNFIKNIKLIK